ncbi:MAG: hypothetical protein LBN24_04090 [Mediterranea sp.]|jgi:hypothetical protein|nr:hypothetical protein [Mediterranea sp.]
MRKIRNDTSIEATTELREQAINAIQYLLHRNLADAKVDSLLSQCTFLHFDEADSLTSEEEEGMRDPNIDQLSIYILLEGACIYYHYPSVSTSKTMVGFAVRSGTLLHTYPTVLNRSEIQCVKESSILRLPLKALNKAYDEELTKMLFEIYSEALLDACAFNRKKWNVRLKFMQEEGLLPYLPEETIAHFLGVNRKSLYRAKVLTLHGYD